MSLSQDLQVIVLFAADFFEQGDFYMMLQSVISKFRRCTAFDHQNSISGMGEHLKAIDPADDFFNNLIVPETQQSSQSWTSGSFS